MVKNWSIQSIHKEMLGSSKRNVRARSTAEELLYSGQYTLDNPSDAAQLSLAFMDMASFDSIDGALAVLAGKSEGWGQLERGFLWKLLELKTLKALYDRDKRPRSNPRDLAVSSLHGLSFRRAEVGWCGEQLRLSLNTGAFRSTLAYPLAVYALWLIDVDCGADPSDYPTSNENDTSVYRNIAKAWSSDSLSEAIVSMCEYHVSRTVDVDDSLLWLEFEFHPYALFPVEFLALWQVRLKFGLPMPACHHALLSTPLAKLPEDPGKEQLNIEIRS